MSEAPDDVVEGPPPVSGCPPTPFTPEIAAALEARRAEIAALVDERSAESDEADQPSGGGEDQ